MASLAAIAEYEDTIRERFTSEQTNSAGVFTATIFIRGKPWLVQVDDSILMERKEQDLFFVFGSSPSTDKETIWS